MTTNTQELAFIIANRLKSNMAGGIKSIQRGIFASTSTANSYVSTDITISAVDTSKSVITHLGNAVNSSGSPQGSVLSFTSSNALNIKQTNGTGTTQYTGWQVVEYY